MSPQLTGILQIAIPVQDIDRATKFYRDTLELRFLMAGPGMAFFDCGGVRLYLDSAKGPKQPAGNSLIYFRTPDIDKQASILKERNVEIYQKPHVIAALPAQDIWLMWIHDSEGNLLGIMEERRK